MEDAVRRKSSEEGRACIGWKSCTCVHVTLKHPGATSDVSQKIT